METTPRPEHTTDGRRRLVEKLKPTGSLTQSEIAEALGIQQSNVSLWAAGRSRPEPHHRQALAILYGIPEPSWLTEDERTVVQRARERKSNKRKAAA